MGGAMARAAGGVVPSAAGGSIGRSAPEGVGFGVAESADRCRLTRDERCGVGWVMTPAATQ